MREIEFRGNRIDNSEWIYGYVEYHLIDGDLTKTEKKAFITYETMDIVGQVYRHKHQVNTKTVGQYTGLKDSKRTDESPEGQKIYESDIVTAFNQIGLVVYRNSMFLIDWYKNGEFDYESYLYKCREIEIVGNIHDNPLELLAT